MENTVHAPWIRAPATRAVIDALTVEGADVRFVGGCVRDALLGRESADIDIGTPDPPERVLALLESAGIETRTVPRGIAHGTVTALAGGERYEITTLRRDERTDGRHAEVAFTDDWQEDAARRDFTINAMSAAPDGTLYDYFGGREDLEAGRVRFVGDPATRIAEDHLRILRFFRFHAWYGKGKPDANALVACADAADTFTLGSYERIQSEILRLLAADDPVPAITAMHETGVLNELLPVARLLEAFPRLVGLERLHASLDPIRRLAALINDSSLMKTATAMKSLADRLRLTSMEGNRLAALVVPPHPPNPSLDRRAQRRLLYRLGREQFRDLVLLVWTAEDENKNAWREMLDYAEKWEAPTLSVAGADVLARGIPEGPEVGRLLEAVENWWIAHDFTADRAALLERLDALVAECRKE